MRTAFGGVLLGLACALTQTGCETKSTYKAGSPPSGAYAAPAGYGPASQPTTTPHTPQTPATGPTGRGGG